MFKVDLNDHLALHSQWEVLTVFIVKFYISYIMVFIRVLWACPCFYYFGLEIFKLETMMFSTFAEDWLAGQPKMI